VPAITGTPVTTPVGTPVGKPIAAPGTDTSGLRPNEVDYGAFVPHRPDRPEKMEGGIAFELVSEYSPAGDQPEAIKELVAGINDNEIGRAHV